MKKVYSLIWKLYSREDGVVFTEYGLLLVGIGIASAGIFALLSADFTTWFAAILDGLTDEIVADPT